MINFLHTYLPQPLIWQFGFLKIYWYGVLIVLALVCGLIFVLKQSQKFGIKKDEVYNLGFYLVIFSLVGARLYAVFLGWQFYFANPLEIIAVWHGGLAIHGAILGGVITLLIYGWKKNQSFWLWADLLAPALALGQAIGRFGNYFNQEVFGKPTNLPCGIPISLANRPAEYFEYQYFQPTFLYESVLNFCNFFILWLLISRLKKKEGTVFLIYLINYSLIRIVMEFLRVDQTLIVFGWRLPILVSLGIIILASILLSKKVIPKV